MAEQLAVEVDVKNVTYTAAAVHSTDGQALLFDNYQELPRKVNWL